MKRIAFAVPLLFGLFGLAGCNNYGEEKTFNGVELYHTKGVTAAEADSLGKFLMNSKFADGTEKTVQLSKSGDTYQFRFVGKGNAANDTSILKTLKFFATILSSQVFKSSPVEVDLCDDRLRTVKTFSSDDLGKPKTFNGTQLYHTKNITDAEADSLGKFIISSKFADGKEKSVQLSKSGDTYQFRFVVKAEIVNDAAYAQNAKNYASVLSKQIFHNAQVEIHFCDDYFNTLKVVPMN